MECQFDPPLTEGYISPPIRDGLQKKAGYGKPRFSSFVGMPANQESGLPCNQKLF